MSNGACFQPSASRVRAISASPSGAPWESWGDPRRYLPRQIPFPTCTEAGAFYCMVTAIFSVDNLWISVVLTSPTYQKIPKYCSKIPSEVTKLLKILQQDSNKISKQFMKFTFRNKVL